MDILYGLGILLSLRYHLDKHVLPSLAMMIIAVPAVRRSNAFTRLCATHPRALFAYVSEMPIWHGGFS